MSLIQLHDGLYTTDAYGQNILLHTVFLTFVRAYYLKENVCVLESPLKSPPFPDLL